MTTPTELVLAYIREHEQGTRVRWCAAHAGITGDRAVRIVRRLVKSGLVDTGDDKILVGTGVWPVSDRMDEPAPKPTRQKPPSPKRRRWGRRPQAQYQGRWCPEHREYVLHCRTCDTQEYGGWTTPAQVRDDAVASHHKFHHREEQVP